RRIGIQTEGWMAFTRNARQGTLRINQLRQAKAKLALLAAVAAGPMLAWPLCAHAASLTWDANGAADSAPLDGAGTWDNAGNSNWWNGTGNVQWNNANNDTAVFGAGTNGGAITVPAGITIGGLTFNNAGYNLG